MNKNSINTMDSLAKGIDSISLENGSNNKIIKNEKSQIETILRQVTLIIFNKKFCLNFSKNLKFIKIKLIKI